MRWHAFFAHLVHSSVIFPCIQLPTLRSHVFLSYQPECSFAQFSPAETQCFLFIGSGSLCSSYHSNSIEPCRFFPSQADLLWTEQSFSITCQGQAGRPISSPKNGSSAVTAPALYNGTKKLRCCWCWRGHACTPTPLAAAIWQSGPDWVTANSRYLIHHGEGASLSAICLFLLPLLLQLF